MHRLPVKDERVAPAQPDFIPAKLNNVQQIGGQGGNLGSVECWERTFLVFLRNGRDLERLGNSQLGRQRVRRQRRPVPFLQRPAQVIRQLDAERIVGVGRAIIHIM